MESNSLAKVHVPKASPAMPAANSLDVPAPSRS
jgi:hypothetical protein